MKWKKIKNCLPGSDTEVLVRCRTIINLAFYSKSDKQFTAKDGTVYCNTDSTLEWKAARTGG